MRRRVLVTRAEEQAGDFAGRLEALGFEAVTFPTIAFSPPADREKTLALLKALPASQWLLLTSANTVRFFHDLLREEGLSLPREIRVCAVGPRTAEAARSRGIKIDLIPEDYRAEGVLEAFRGVGIEGAHIFFPRAEEGREILPEGLAALGAEVVLAPVYRTVMPEGGEARLRALLEEGIDVITFTSGSTVRNFLAILGEAGRPLIEHIPIACISPVTARVAEDLGIKTHILPEEYTTAALALAIKKAIG